MKRVVLRDRGQFKAREVVTTIAESPSPGTGVTYGEMHQRERILDAIDRHKSDGYIDLEDADHAKLKSLMEAFPFATAKRELRLILDDIAQAKSPEETMSLKVVEGGSA